MVRTTAKLVMTKSWRRSAIGRCGKAAQLPKAQIFSSYGGTLIYAACFLDGDGIFARSETVTNAARVA
jgi:hypothetical protein